MNALQKCWYRTFQVCFKAVSGLLPWRKPEILEGEGSIFKVGEIIKQKGLKKAMIVTGPNISKTNMLDNLYKGLSDNGIEYVVFNKTVQNPTIDVVENALAEYKANGCQCIVALGGGSSMDSAKAMGARLARPKKPVPKLKGVLKVMHRLPLFSPFRQLPEAEAKLRSPRSFPIRKLTKNTLSTTSTSFLTMRFWSLL